MYEFLLKPLFFNFILLISCIGFAPNIQFGRNKLENVTLSFCLGMGFLSLVILVGGLAGLYHAYFFHSLLIIGCALGVRRLYSSGFISLTLPKNRYEILFLTLIGLIMVWIFLTCLTPAYMYDSLEYHFSIPEQYLIDQQITPIFYNLHSNMPFMAHMPWVLLLFYSNVHACKIFIFIQLLAMLFLQYAMARRVLNRLWSLISIFVFLCAYTTLWTHYHIHIGNDVTRQLYLNASIICALWFLIQKKKTLLITSGIFLGFSLGTKYFSFLFGIPTLFFILLSHFQGVRWYQRLKEAVCFFAIAFVIFSPWMMKQFAHTGNPIYPIFSNHFPTKDNFMYPAIRRTLYSESGHTGSAIDMMVTEERFNPWTVVINHFKRFVTPYRDFLMLPGFLFSLLALFYRNKYIKILGLIGVLFYLEALLLGSVHWYRYFVTNYSIIAITFTFFIKKLAFHQSFPVKMRYLFFTFGFIMLINTFFTPRIQAFFKDCSPPLFVLSKEGFPNFYRKHSLEDYYEATQRVNSIIPEESKILVFDNYLSYNFRRRRIIPGMDGIEALYRYFWKDKNVIESLEILWQEGVNYIILFPTPANNQFTAPKMKTVYTFCQTAGNIIYEDDYCIIYNIPSRSEWFRLQRMQQKDNMLPSSAAEK